ncbi:MAG: hypothetical protein M1839_005592 [Geoglossum umbratile]|nr:MAG: hypothetical protein M1839_005592 [Geoglossum umbratile]
MDSSGDAYASTPINSADYEIRVLELLPGPEGSQLSGTLIRHSLEDECANRPYEALSYVWGEAAAARTIKLGQNSSLKITENLEAALQVLRYQDRARMIWVDAICINQDDVKERDHQVQLMRRIYRNAKMVRVWLDLDIDPECPAMAKLQTFNDQSTDEDLGTDALFWEPLSVVFKNPYWTRVWIQQEITSAVSLAVQCRKVLLPVVQLYHYVRVFNSRVAGTDINTLVWVGWLEVSPNIQLPKRFRLVDSSDEPLEGSTLGEGDLNLLEVLSYGFKLECTDDRDRVYGMLYLACDYLEGDIAVRYENSVEVAYTSVAHFTLQKYRSLNFLLYAGLNWRDPPKERLLPTWVPDWRDPHTRMWLSYKPKFSQPAPPFVQRRTPWISTNSAVLHAYGTCIDCIEEIFYFPESVALYNTPATTFLDACRLVIRKTLSSQSTAEGDSLNDNGEFRLPQWHTLVRVLTGVDNLKPDDPDAHAKLKQLVSMSADAFVRTAQSSEAQSENRPLSVLDIISMNTTPPSESGQAFARLAWGTIGKHQPFVGANGGIGMAIKGTRPGDQIWIVFGCDKPMILRPAGDHFLVVSEGYYDGANRGELLEDIPEDLNKGDRQGGYEVKSIRIY